MVVLTYMVLFKIIKDVPHTGLMYAYTKINNLFGRVTVVDGNQVNTISTSTPRVVVVDNTDTYSRVRIDAMFVYPRPFRLRAFEIGGYLSVGQQHTPIMVVRAENMDLSLPLGSYYIVAVVSLQTPQTFDLFIR